MLRPVCPPVPVSPSPPPSPRREARSLLTWPLVTTVHPASPNQLLPYRPSPHYRGRVRLRYWPDHVILRFHLLGGFPRPWRRSPHSLPRGTSPTRAWPPQRYPSPRSPSSSRTPAALALRPLSRALHPGFPARPLHTRQLSPVTFPPGSLAWADCVTCHPNHDTSENQRIVTAKWGPAVGPSHRSLPGVPSSLA